MEEGQKEKQRQDMEEEEEDGEEEEEGLVEQGDTASSPDRVRDFR